MSFYIFPHLSLSYLPDLTIGSFFCFSFGFCISDGFIFLFYSLQSFDYSLFISFHLIFEHFYFLLILISGDHIFNLVDI